MFGGCENKISGLAGTGLQARGSRRDSDAAPLLPNEPSGGHAASVKRPLSTLCAMPYDFRLLHTRANVAYTAGSSGDVWPLWRANS
jgi:hypothetical protein